MSSWIKALDYVFLLRPTQFFPLWITFMCGVIVAREPVFFTFTDIPALPLLFFTLNSGSAFIFNQITDQRSDALNNKLFLISDGHISLKTAWVEALGLSLISLAWAAAFSLPFFFSMLLITIFGLLYSFAGFMSHPALSILINGIGGALSFGCGYLSSIPSPDFSMIDLLVYSLPYGLAWGGISVLVAIPDIHGDKLCDKKTFPVIFGIQRSYVLALMLNVFTLISSLLTQNEFIFITIGLTSGVGSIIFFLNFHSESISESASQKPVKLSMIVLALSTIAYIPLFFLILFMNFMISKMYYQARFNLNYPKIS